MKRTATLFVIALSCFLAGLMVGRSTHGVRQTEAHEYYSKTYDFVKGECSIDGKVWYPMRKDGVCYAADAPK